jgi:hypothetical protein
MEREEVLKTLEAKTEELDFTSGEFRGSMFRFGL